MKGLRIGASKYYHDLLTELIVTDKTLDQIPKITIQDCTYSNNVYITLGCNTLRISREELIQLVIKCKSSIQEMCLSYLYGYQSFCMG